MIHTLASIDLVANAGESPWHRASGLAKLVLGSVMVGLAVFGPSLRLLLVLYAVAWALVLTARLPWRLVLLAALYPLAFAALFVLARWDGTLRTPALVLARPLVAGLTTVWLVGTTPYPDLFAPLSRLLPGAVADGLFLTYRALFELVSRTGRLTRALRLRGGTSIPLRRRLTLAGEALGTLVLYGFDRSQRLYATMHLRGHSGRVCGCRHWAELTRADSAVAAVTVAVVTVAVVLWRAA
jgi:energy-coupling factor transporter transmembrane protein EcfT